MKIAQYKTSMIATFLILSWNMVAWLIAQGYYATRVQEIVEQKTKLTQQQAGDLADGVRRDLNYFNGIPGFLSQTTGVRGAVSRFGTSGAPSPMPLEVRKKRWTDDHALSGLSEFLRRAQISLHADLIYVVDAAGDCIAASNSGTPGSPIGTNFAERDIFRMNRNNQPAMQYAVGKTTHIAGFFFGSPIFIEGRFLGAVVAKSDVPNLAFLIGQTSALVTDENGVVILARDKGLEMHSMSDAAVSSMPEQKKFDRYRRNEFPSLRIEPWGNENFVSLLRIQNGITPHILVARDVSEYRLKVYVDTEAADVVSLTRDKSWFAFLLGSSGSVLILMFVGAAHYLNSIRKSRTQLQSSMEALRASEAGLAEAQRIAGLGNWDWNIVTGRLFWSDGVYIIFGRTPQQLTPTYDAFIDAVHPDDRQFVIDSVNKALHKRIPYSIDYRIVRPDGTERIVHAEGEVTFDEKGTPVRMFGTVQDVTEQRHAQERLNYLAHYDLLSGLPNRVLLHDRLQQAMRDADRNERMVAVMILDLDRFKTVNDTLGHDAGDALLKAVAQRLVHCLRACDTISRLGGDEFAIVLTNVAHVDNVTGVVEKIMQQFVSPFRLGDRDVFASPSIGITLYPLDEKQPEHLLKDADVAMYHAKELGRNTFQFYTPELNARAARRLELETGLRRALERQELVLHYQPLVDMKTGRIRGMEALLRWQHPEFGLLPPLDFISLAEDTGLILPIGEWVIRTACAQIRAWHGTGFPALQVAVNLSSKQLRDKNLIKIVQQALQETGIEAHYLDLELTESVLMQDMELAATILKELKSVGVSFSLDDFGTGYSSLSYLKHFPIDYVKIDRSFVRDMLVDPVGAGLVRAIIAMAHTLGIKVIAEGVESHGQLAFLRQEGCDITQGYFCSPPVDVTAFTGLLRDWNELRPGKCRVRGG